MLRLGQPPWKPGVHPPRPSDQPPEHNPPGRARAYPPHPRLPGRARAHPPQPSPLAEPDFTRRTQARRPCGAPPAVPGLAGGARGFPRCPGALAPSRTVRATEWSIETPMSPACGTRRPEARLVDLNPQGDLGFGVFGGSLSPPSNWPKLLRSWDAAARMWTK